MLTTATLLGSAGADAAGRLRHRALAATAACCWRSALLMVATGLGFAVVHDFWPLLLVAFVGTLNPSSGDVSVFLPLEQALLPQTVERPRAHRALRPLQPGRLAGGRVRRALRRRCPTSPAARALHPARRCRRCSCSTRCWRWPSACSTAASRRPSSRPKRRRARRSARRAASSTRSRRSSVWIRLAAASSCSRCWRSGSSTASTLGGDRAGTIFFWTGVFSAFSYLVAASHRRAHRAGQDDGLHAPAVQPLPGRSSRFMPNLPLAIAFLLVRSTAVADGRADAQLLRDGGRDAGRAPRRGQRHLGAAQPGIEHGPLLSGWLLLLSGFGWPLLMAGLLKSGYDLALLALFRHVRPLEERVAACKSASPPSRS